VGLAFGLDATRVLDLVVICGFDGAAAAIEGLTTTPTFLGDTKFLLPLLVLVLGLILVVLLCLESDAEGVVGSTSTIFQ
jgi:hypothetical protein